MPSASRTKNDRIIIRTTVEEREWVTHAASLRGLSLAEYVRRAINVSLRHEGVDAVLFLERERRRAPRHQDAPL